MKRYTQKIIFLDNFSLFHSALTFALAKKIMKPNIIKASLAALLSVLCMQTHAQNLLSNGNFDELNACLGPLPDFSCIEGWSTATAGDDGNSPDLCYAGALFFPLVSTTAHSGLYFLGLECSTTNPEYAQIQLSEPLVAGASYCITFRAAQYEEGFASPTVGITFSSTPLSNSPFEQGLSPAVSGQLSPEPNAWQTITGSFTANGDENYLIVSGFDNNSTGPFPYVYFDSIELIECSSETVTEEILFFAPTAFTPNGDGRNDVFQIVGPETATFELVIYDRWGATVYTSKDINEAWTGNKNGGTYFVQDGLYHYVFKASISSTEFIEEQGTVTVLR